MAAPPRSRPARPRRPVPPRRVRAYVGLGANLGDPAATLAAGIRALAALPGARLAGVSRLYATAPVGVVDQPEFRNAAVALDVAGRPGPRDRRPRAARRPEGPRARLRPARARALGPARARPRPARLRPPRHPRRATAGRPQRRPGESGRPVAGGPPRVRPRPALRPRAAGRPRPRPAPARLGRDGRDRPRPGGRRARARTPCARSPAGTPRRVRATARGPGHAVRATP